jgi:protease II
MLGRTPAAIASPFTLASGARALFPSATALSSSAAWRGDGGRRPAGGGPASGGPSSRARAAVALGLLAATGASAVSSAESARPPIAPRRPHIVKIGKVDGEDRGPDVFDPPIEIVDDFFWLRDDKREDKEVLAHLAAENTFTDARTAHLDAFRQALYKELLSHVKETDDTVRVATGRQRATQTQAQSTRTHARTHAYTRATSSSRSPTRAWPAASFLLCTSDSPFPLSGAQVPYPVGKYDYYTRTIEGLAYVLHCRRPRGSKGEEQLLLDENALAKVHPDHCDVGAVEPSPSGQLLGWSVDGKGYETYSIYFKKVGAETPLPDVLEETSGEMVWGGDDRTVYYTKFDEAHRPCSVWKHTLGKRSRARAAVRAHSRPVACCSGLVCAEQEERRRRCASSPASASASGRANRRDGAAQRGCAHALPRAHATARSRPPRLCAQLTLDWSARPPVGTPQSSDAELFAEPDGLFYVSIDKSRDGRLLLVNAHSTETSEVHLLELTDAAGVPRAESDPAAALRVLQPRQFKLRYSVSHRHGSLFITTNLGDAHNQQVMVAPLATPGAAHWTPLADTQGVPVLPHDASRTIGHATCFENHLVVKGREDGLTQVWVLAMAGKGPAVREWHRVAWPEAAYECGLGPNEEFATQALRLHFSSPVTPRRSLSYEMNTRAATVLKQQEVPLYDGALYATARRQIEARDGTLVPVTLLWRKDKVNVGSADAGAPAVPAPLHLYGYGSYGMCVEPSFSSRTLPLIDRGVVYAIAHVRGGSENGRYQWYEEAGKYLSKRNTFNDFVDVAAGLVATGWTRPEVMSCEGRSAGGLLMGNVLNQAPHLFRAAIAGVPFVDLVVTMCDPSIPLTTGEWEEWGNPNQPKCAWTSGATPRARYRPSRSRPRARVLPVCSRAALRARCDASRRVACSGSRGDARCVSSRRRHASRCEQVLRVHALLLADQPGAGAALPERPRHVGPARPARCVLGAGQVGPDPARQTDQRAGGRQGDPAQDGPERRPLLRERPVQVPARARLRLRVAS